MNTKAVLMILSGLALSILAFIPAQAEPDADEVRLIAVMEQMEAASMQLAALENTLLSSQAELGQAAGTLLAEYAGVSDDLVAGREAEFGRAITNVVRTFQMSQPYEHRANDALVKRDLEWLQYLKDKGQMADAVRHDIELKTPLFVRRGEWIKKTGDFALALDSMTDASCFRDMVVATGFTKTSTQLSYVSPYKEVLEAGTKRGMFTITEQEIHEQFTVPTLLGYAKVLGVDVEISPWNDADRVITISVVTPDSSAQPLQTQAAEY
jgi:hypothetical protein